MKILKPVFILFLLCASLGNPLAQTIENHSFEQIFGCGSSPQDNSPKGKIFNDGCFTDPNAIWSWGAALGVPYADKGGACDATHSAVFAANIIQHAGTDEVSVNGSSIFYTFSENLTPGDYGLSFCFEGELAAGSEGATIIVAVAKGLQNQATVTPNTVGTLYEIYDDEENFLPKTGIAHQNIGSSENVENKVNKEFITNFTINPGDTYNQIWFYGIPLSSGVAKICIDDVILTKCEDILCQDVSNLTSCTLTDKTGYIDLQCDEGSIFSLESPEGSNPNVFDCDGHFIVTNATAGTYVVTIQSPNGCTARRTYEVVETCCEGGLDCPAPENLGCDFFAPFNLTFLTWDPVPDVLGYELHIYPGDCSSTSFPVAPIFVESTNFNLDALDLRQFAWAVRAVCADESLSDFSATACFSNDECGGSGPGFTDPESDRIENNRKALIYPNPNKGVFDILLTDLNEGELKIFNQSGVVVFQKQVTASRFSLDLKDLPAGIYWALIASGKESISEKIIIQ